MTQKSISESWHFRLRGDFRQAATRSVAGALLFLVGTLGLPVTPASGFEVQCQILDPATGQPAVRFRPGDDLAVRLQVDVPAGAAKDGIKASISARVKARGVKLTTEMGKFDLQVPNSADRAQLPGFEDAADALDEGVTLDETRTVRLPDELPEGTITLKIGVTIPGLGKDNCQADAEIRD